MLENSWSAVGNPTSILGPPGSSFDPSGLAPIGIHHLLLSNLTAASSLTYHWMPQRQATPSPMVGVTGQIDPTPALAATQDSDTLASFLSSRMFGFSKLLTIAIAIASRLSEYTASLSVLTFVVVIIVLVTFTLMVTLSSRRNKTLSSKTPNHMTSLLIPDVVEPDGLTCNTAASLHNLVKTGPM